MDVEDTLDGADKMIESSLDGGDKMIQPSLDGCDRMIRPSLGCGDRMVDSSLDGGDQLIQQSSDGGDRMVDSSLDAGDRMIQQSLGGGDRMIQQSSDGGDRMVDSSLDAGDRMIQQSLGGGDRMVDSSLDGGDQMMQQSLDGGDRMVESSVAQDLTTSGADKNREPYEGMVFESEAAARAYYDEYAGREGFLTRVLSSRKSERDGSIISRGLGCKKNFNVQKLGNISNDTGEKRRDSCTAMLLIKKDSTGKWVVRKFVRDHNHPIAVSSPKSCPTFDEKDKRIQELTAELRIKKRLSAAYREQLLILMKDVENHNDHLTSKIQIIRNNLTELEARTQEVSDHGKTGL